MQSNRILDNVYSMVMWYETRYWATWMRIVMRCFHLFVNYRIVKGGNQLVVKPYYGVQTDS